MFFSQKLPQKHPQKPWEFPNIFSDNFLGESPPLIVGLKRRTESFEAPLATGPLANRYKWRSEGPPKKWVTGGYNPTYKA